MSEGIVQRNNMHRRPLCESNVEPFWIHMDTRKYITISPDTETRTLSCTIRVEAPFYAYNI